MPAAGIPVRRAGVRCCSDVSSFRSPAGSDGEAADRGFPAWLTLPSDQDLTGGRSWHLFFAWAFVLNGLAYL
ncbi:hypothetical protein MKL11_21905, partial [Methylobacterium sp. J-077]|nr:hypothetical protein [Methylobacterium sp. J-077]